MRRHSKSTPPPITPKQQPQPTLTIERTYRLLTPLCGGGVEPYQCDPITIIRPTEIRGHLRFWWRACRGGDYSSLKELKDAEDAIWGKVHKKDDKDTLKYYETVQITVEIIGKGEHVEPFYITWNMGTREYEAKPSRDSKIPDYAAFPLKPTNEELKKISPHLSREELRKHTRKVYKDISFTLIITFPNTDKHRKEIKAALWAWETFGGIGARTRRGFGALHLLKTNQHNITDLPLSSNPNHVREWINNKLTHHVLAGPLPPGTPLLNQNPQFIKPIGPYDSAAKAWEELIKNLRRFRQPGRGQGKWTGSKEVTQIVQDYPEHNDYTFPKAALGLPIVYHLKDGLDVTLQGTNKGQERLASPLILRPLQVSDREFFGLALLLTGTYIKDDPNIPPGGLILKWRDEETGSREPEETTVSVAKGQEDVLQLFMNSFSRRTTQIGTHC